MFRCALIALLFSLSFSAAAQPMAPDMPRPGIDYEELQAPQPTYSNVKGKIEVAEVFSYACHFCAAFQGYVGPWKKNLPSDVNFIYVPMVGRDAWPRFARGFYAAQAKNIQVRSHEAVFKAIFVEDKLSTMASIDEIADFYVRYGVDKKKFIDLMLSAPVDNELAKSTQFAMRAGVTGTPTVVIAGKYKVFVTRDRSYEGMIRTIDFVLAKERAALKSQKLKPVAAK